MLAALSTLFLLEGLTLFPELSTSCLTVVPLTSSHFFAANRHLLHTSPFMQLSSCRECSSVTEREGRSEENPCTSPRFCILESFAEVGLQTAKPLDSSGCILPPLAGLAVLHTLYFALYHSFVDANQPLEAIFIDLFTAAYGWSNHRVLALAMCGGSLYSRAINKLQVGGLF